MSIDDGKIHLIVGDTRPTYKGPEPLKLHTESVEATDYVELLILTDLLKPIFEKETRRKMRYTDTPIPDECKVVIQNIRVVWKAKGFSEEYEPYFVYEWSIL